MRGAAREAGLAIEPRENGREQRHVSVMPRCFFATTRGAVVRNERGAHGPGEFVRCRAGTEPEIERAGAVQKIVSERRAHLDVELPPPRGFPIPNRLPWNDETRGLGSVEHGHKSRDGPAAIPTFYLAKRIFDVENPARIGGMAHALCRARYGFGKGRGVPSSVHLGVTKRQCQHDGAVVLARKGKRRARHEGGAVGGAGHEEQRQEQHVALIGGVLRVSATRQGEDHAR